MIVGRARNPPPVEEEERTSVTTMVVQVVLKVSSGLSVFCTSFQAPILLPIVVPEIRRDAFRIDMIDGFEEDIVGDEAEEDEDKRVNVGSFFEERR